MADRKKIIKIIVYIAIAALLFTALAPILSGTPSY